MEKTFSIDHTLTMKTRASIPLSKICDIKENFSLVINVKQLLEEPLLSEGLPISVTTFPLQRGYCWSEDTSLSFAKSILERSTVNIGSFFLYCSKKSLEIVDGQQRLFTLLMIIEAIRSLRSEEEDIKITSNSLFSSILLTDEERCKNEENIELSSRIQIAKNFIKIKQWLSDYMNSNTNFKGEIVHNLLETELFLYITLNQKEASDYYINCNLTGTPLTPSQLLKAYHFRIIGVGNYKENYNENQDVRYFIEAWRQGLITQPSEKCIFSRILDIQKPDESLNEFTRAKDTKFEELKIKIQEAYQEKRTNKRFIKSLWKEDLDFGLDDFIASNDYVHTYYNFEGLLNTVQLVISGGNPETNSSYLAAPIFGQSNNYPGGILRLQESEDTPQFTTQNILWNLLWMKPGIQFFKTTFDLLESYERFRKIFSSITKNEYTDGFSDQTKLKVDGNKDLMQTAFNKALEALLQFERDCKSLGYQEETEKMNYREYLLSVFCLSLIYCCRFLSSRDAKPQDIKFEQLKYLIYAALWGASCYKQWFTTTRAFGIYDIGYITILSPTYSIAKERFIANIRNDVRLREKLTEIKQKHPDNLQDYPSIVPLL